MTRHTKSSIKQIFLLSPLTQCRTKHRQRNNNNFSRCNHQLPIVRFILVRTIKQTVSDNGHMFRQTAAAVSKLDIITTQQHEDERRKTHHKQKNLADSQQEYHDQMSTFPARFFKICSKILLLTYACAMKDLECLHAKRWID